MKSTEGKERKSTQEQPRSFTLTEMLVVVAIIALLSMIMFKVGVYLFQKSGRARAAHTIQQVKNFLEEYHSVYGAYPNCTGFMWDNVDEGAKPPGWNDMVNAAPPLTGNVPRGLAYYMWSDDIPENYRRRWQEFVGDKRNSNLDHVWHHAKKCDDSMANYGNPGGAFVYSNERYRVTDPWDRDYQYYASNNLQSYLLYSTGPDGTNPIDDIGRSRWVE